MCNISESFSEGEKICTRALQLGIRFLLRNKDVFVERNRKRKPTCGLLVLSVSKISRQNVEENFRRDKQVINENRIGCTCECLM